MALPIAYKKPRGSARDAEVAAQTMRRVRRRQHAQLDGCVARRDGGRDDSAHAAGRAHAPRVHTVNNSWTTRWLYQRATRHIVVTGEALKAQLVRDNGFDPLAHHVGAHGIDLAGFRPLDRARRVPGAASMRDRGGDRRHAARLEGPRRPARRVGRAAGQGWQLLVIGDGPRRAHLERRVAEMGLARDVRFTGNQDDVPAWYACADIAVLPSFGDEGVPQSLMQAAACGLPAISTPIGAIAEAVRDGKTGSSCRRAT
jgi:hypothetical protein